MIFRTSFNELRFTVIFAVLFCINAAILLLESSERFPEPIVIHWPILVCTLVMGAIWVGVGRWHFAFKLAVSTLLAMLMLYVSATYWIYNVMPEVPYAQFPWLLLTLATGFVVTSVSSLFITISVPLAICGAFNTNERPVFSISQLLAATTCVALTIAIAVTWFPSPDWLLIYASHMAEVSIHPLVIKLYATDVIRDISVAYTSLACLFYFRSRYVYILGIAFSVALLTTVVHRAILKVNSSEFDIAAILDYYMAGQIFVAIMTTYLLLDFTSDPTDNRKSEVNGYDA